MPSLRTLTPFLLLLISIARPCPAQEATTRDNARVIAAIRAEQAAIEREAPTQRRTTHEVYNFSLEGGELTGFYRGDELRKLYAELYGETWQGTQEFFFADGELILIHAAVDVYRGMLGEGGVLVRIKHTYYLDSGRLVHHVRTQHPRRVDRDLAGYDPDVEWLRRSARLLAACAAAPPGDDAPECTAPDR